MPKPARAYDSEQWHPYCPRCMTPLKKTKYEGYWRLDCPVCVWSIKGEAVIAAHFTVMDADVAREYGLEPAWQRVRQMRCP